jgi:hypothetical protein
MQLPSVSLLRRRPAHNGSVDGGWLLLTIISMPSAWI